ncbi:MAG: T9SS type A sorting domain-containing protein [Flavobacteriia bacterium]|nr:T9SS type A sorting domain-containing protein [Flavobacteriia bacterium]
MKSLSLFILLISGFGLFGQTCIPLDSGTIWHNRHAQLIYPPGYTVNNDQIFSLSDLDTTINGITYRRLYDNRFGTSYHGGLRADSLRAWVLPRDSANEILAYDFSLEVGDTVRNLYAAPFTGFQNIYQIVTRKDSVIINGTWCTRIELDGPNYEWIYGIGSTTGMFWNAPRATVDNGYGLLCMSVRDTALYPQYDPQGCKFGIYISEEELGELVFYPNPASKEISIERDLNVERVRIVNLKGQSILETAIEEGIISLADIPPGTYIILGYRGGRETHSSNLVVAR